MKILGLTGLEGSGKDTAAGYVKEWGDNLGLAVERRGFADILKYSAAVLLGMTHEEAQTNDGYLNFTNALKERGEISITIPFNDEEKAADMGATTPVTMTMSGRQFLRNYGTEAHRDVFGYDFWVDALFSEYDYAPKYSDSYPGELLNPDVRPDVLVIPDVRFDNEAEGLRSRGGFVWEIHRAVEVEGDHVSEHGIDSSLINCSIRNETDLSDLRKATFDTCNAFLL